MFSQFAPTEQLPPTLRIPYQMALQARDSSLAPDLADAILLRPLPIVEPGSVLTVSTNTGNNPSGGVGVEPALGLVGLGASDPATFVVVPIALLPITMAAATSRLAAPR
jgi:hypothetical protein